MIRSIIEASKILAFSGVSVMAGTAVQPAITESTHIPLGTAVSICVFLVGAAIYIGRKLQRWEDQINELKDKISSRPCLQPPSRCDKGSKGGK